ncbi:hypothetical protein [Alkalibacillus almallahensis]|uniref:hypothetical protein n=1 Tax=Alkalibacillus almallahensis TaxID=1379154 RepID=UPI001423C8D3|nr:hypothetical protein [Alkalibacillus almallahensis]NIK11427.1 uncharacterized protein YqhQ [Alkalibacillus almallahensis]
MADEKKEYVEKHEEPSRTGATAIKSVTAIIITLLILGFLVFYVFPMFGGGASQDLDGSHVEMSLNENASNVIYLDAS